MNLKTRKYCLLSSESLSVLTMLSAGIGILVYQSNPETMLRAWIGLVIFFSGVMQILSVFLRHQSAYSAHGFLTRGGITAAAGIFVMLKSIFAPDALRVLLSTMVLMNGLQLMNCFTQLKNQKKQHRMAIVLLGLVQVIFGVLGFLRPGLLFGASTGIVLGISILVDTLVTGCISYLSITWFLKTQHLVMK